MLKTVVFNQILIAVADLLLDVRDHRQSVDSFIARFEEVFILRLKFLNQIQSHQTAVEFLVQFDDFQCDIATEELLKSRVFCLNRGQNSDVLVDGFQLAGAVLDFQCPAPMKRDIFFLFLILNIFSAPTILCGECPLSKCQCVRPFRCRN